MSSCAVAETQEAVPGKAEDCWRCAGEGKMWVCSAMRSVKGEFYSFPHFRLGGGAVAC